MTDLHRHFIDHLEVPSPSGGEPLKRVPDVFDCWFESGSMPYAQQHYPFENKERFEGNFPADFIAEGLDQTRGWFYTLMVLSTALFDKPAFKNLVCNGLVLASDGKKMSKRLKNYPDPTTVRSCSFHEPTNLVFFKRKGKLGQMPLQRNQARNQGASAVILPEQQTLQHHE